jgi:mitochondrial inner membrane protease ATP23
MSNEGPITAEVSNKITETLETSRCQKYLNKLLKSSPMVKFLLDALTKSSCPHPKIQCVPCPPSTQATGIYDPEIGVALCDNWINDGITAEDTLAHELIHAYDYCRVKFDRDNCRHNACSEIRAANLSGDCKWSRELFRGNFGKIVGQHQRCVKRRAVLSLKSNPACKDCKDVDKLVDEVFSVCFSDTAPFLDIP